MKRISGEVKVCFRTVKVEVANYDLKAENAHSTEAAGQEQAVSLSALH